MLISGCSTSLLGATYSIAGKTSRRVVSALRTRLHGRHGAEKVHVLDMLAIHFAAMVIHPVSLVAEGLHVRNQSELIFEQNQQEGR